MRIHGSVKSILGPNSKWTVRICHIVWQSLQSKQQAVGRVPHLCLSDRKFGQAQALGACLLPRLVPRLALAVEPDAADDEKRGDARGRHLDAAPGAAALIALLEFVEVDAEQAGEQLEAGVGLGVLARAGVGGDRFGALVGVGAVFVDLEAQRRAEALLGLAPILVRGVRLAADDQAQDAVLASQPLELEDLLVDPDRFGRRWRADDDQIARLFQGIADRCAEIGRGRQFLAIAKDRVGALRDDAVTRCPADQTLGRPVALNRLVQPLAPAVVVVAVAYERPIFRITGHC